MDAAKRSKYKGHKTFPLDPHSLRTNRLFVSRAAVATLTNKNNVVSAVALFVLVVLFVQSTAASRPSGALLPMPLLSRRSGIRAHDA